MPRRVIRRALEQRRELLSMNFDADRATTEHSVADLELRSVICVPLVRIKAGTAEDTSMLSAAEHTVGVLYLDSRLVAADLAGGNRELLQTLAIEASTMLENARLLEEERGKQKIEEELNVARTIQQKPAAAQPAGRRVVSRHRQQRGVAPGGRRLLRRDAGGSQDCWAAVVADVSGKGVSSALLASLLQGALLTVSDRHPPAGDAHSAASIATCTSARRARSTPPCSTACWRRTDSSTFINAGHCSPIRVSRNGSFEYLDTTSMPVGMMEDTDSWRRPGNCCRATSW